MKFKGDIKPPPPEDPSPSEFNYSEESWAEEETSTRSTQTEPGFNAADFDWDLSESADAEVQTVPLSPTRHTADSRDAFAQTDQRLLCLAIRSGRSAGGQHGRIETKDESCQTASGPLVHRAVQTDDQVVGCTSRSVSAHSALTRRLTAKLDLKRLGRAPKTAPSYTPSPEPMRTDPSRKDVEVQTDNDVVTDEAPQYAAKPPPCRKVELLTLSGANQLIPQVDQAAMMTPSDAMEEVSTLVQYFVDVCGNDHLLLVRAYFIWIATFIRYDWEYMDGRQSPNDIISSRAGVCRDFVTVFVGLCEASRIKVKKLHGFARGYDFRPGCVFRPGEGVSHAWNAVFLRGAWWLLDCTWGTGYVDTTGQFQRRLDEHYFLTDPDEFAWTHYPHDNIEQNYSRWQLLQEPITLDEFNNLPLVSSHFFVYGLKIKKGPPLEVREQVEVLLTTQQPVRFKYKFFLMDTVESTSHNRNVFCHLKENRSIASYLVVPPEEGRYLLKVYANIERHLGDMAILDHVVTFILNCSKARRQVQPWPAHELPWGLTQDFFATGAVLLNQPSPVIVLWGGKRQLVLHKTTEMLTLFQLYDADGNNVTTKGVVGKDENEQELRLTIASPHQLGYYKLLLYGIKKPKTKGKWRVPLIAAFLLDNKVTRSSARKKSKQHRL